MMNRLFLGIAIAGVSTAAFAADFPVKAPSPPPAVVPPPYNWNGCYVGGNAGGKWANSSGNVDIPPGPGLPATTTPFDLSGGNNNGSFIGGGQLGCNYQISQIVLGIEGDADWQHLSRTGTLIEAAGGPSGPGFSTSGSFNLTSNWQTSLRGRFGYAVGGVLWYATGGVAWTRESFAGDATFVFPGETIALNIVPVSKTVVGATAGGGLEYAVTDQLTLGLEGRYTWYGSQHFDTFATDILPGVTGSLNLNTAEIIGKLNWKFSGTEERREGRR